MQERFVLLKRTQMNARTLHCFEKNGCPTLYFCNTNFLLLISLKFSLGVRVAVDWRLTEKLSKLKLLQIFSNIYTWWRQNSYIFSEFMVVFLCTQRICRQFRINNNKNIKGTVLHIFSAQIFMIIRCPDDLAPWCFKEVRNLVTLSLEWAPDNMICAVLALFWALWNSIWLRSLLPPPTSTARDTLHT